MRRAGNYQLCIALRQSIANLQHEYKQEIPGQARDDNTRIGVRDDNNKSCLLNIVIADEAAAKIRDLLPLHSFTFATNRHPGRSGSGEPGTPSFA